jgi:hypothetical protein
MQGSNWEKKKKKLLFEPPDPGKQRNLSVTVPFAEHVFSDVTYSVCSAENNYTRTDDILAHQH